MTAVRGFGMVVIIIVAGGVDGDVVYRGFALASPDDPHGHGVPRLFLQTADDVFGSFVIWF